MEGSKKFSISKVELIKKAKSLARGALYSVIVGVIVIISNANIPAEYVLFVPIIVTILTNLSHTVKLYCTDTLSVSNIQE
jgi:hypothetical protein